MKSNWKLLALMALLSSVVTLAAYNFLGFNNRDVIFNESSPTPTITGRLAALTGNGPMAAPNDFSTAAESVTPTVVHIRTTITRTVRQQQMPDIFREFFGDEFGQGQNQGQSRPRRQQGQASGSGVIISKDGYIVTNNHVVQDADEVEVIMTDKRSFKAKVIGTDPLTDLAVIKVEANNLPAIVLGDSDALRLGEWVLAVGYPLDLESTVTAGIVSAKGRGIGILQRENARQQPTDPKADTPIEAFIQTDAAINPGNSGGALVNLRGELIGINSAIASATGYYSGYGFAVPVSLVKKVSADLLKYGNVQRGYLGILPIELNSTIAKEKGAKVGRGIYVDSVVENGAASAAGLKKGDVIVKMEGQPLDSDAQMREIIGRRRPGDAVTVTINRDGSERDVKLELRNRNGGRDVIKKTEVATVNASLKSLGADFEELSAQDAKQLGITGGVRVKKIVDGKLAETDIEEGFIIVKANGKNVKTTKDLQTIMSAVKEGEGLMLIGMYPNSSRMYYYAVPV
ncbi:Do family serine endopeptidase [Spirosoma utsteinense]|uniref:Do/DeqQ family serine protease n=1 Tax=Spirosoma utsteinense TaxID=2585773 RepID=A0ABR6W3G7_9BACT|nr:Do family serine endopeptidase [Spirosoma utsteinense]MBC3784817.1 Do/DeqQ family serine protease [Spirosoma utsteinense]MBC3791146.1 Do/DeqQ family serine protease [Spirosoma utsteinense]